MLTALFDTRAGMVLYLLLRVLAIADAVMIPAIVMWWFYKQPNHGGSAGSLAAVVMGFWALKRGYRAVFAFEEYNWMVVKIGTILAVIVAIHLVMKHWASLGGVLA